MVVLGGGSLRNVTLHGNAAGGTGGAPTVLPGGRGGSLAVYVSDAAANRLTLLNNVTVADNSAGVGGGIAAIGQDSLNPRIEIGNSIVAQNAGGNCVALTGGTIASLGYNLETDADCGLSATGDQQDAEAGLLPLGSYGGPTMTRALFATSDALEAGNPAVPGSGGGACEATDQRGVPRPQGPVCDAGSFEGSLSVVAVPGPGAIALVLLAALLAASGLIRLKRGRWPAPLTSPGQSDGQCAAARVDRGPWGWPRWMSWSGDAPQPRR